MTAAVHPLALRTPWYVLERVPLPVTDPAARRPAIQKYDSSEFVRQLIADPRVSLKFHAQEDVWSFPVPIGAFRPNVTGRERFTTSRLVYTPMRKLYQPSHDRFYAVTIELFCDQPGLPRPGVLRDVDLRFVLRRERIGVDNVKAARQLACELAVELDKEKRPQDPVSSVPETDDVDDVLWVERTEGRTFTSAQLDQLALINPERVVEVWTRDLLGRNKWTTIDPDAPIALAPDEREFPMWRLPARRDDCAAGRTRSLWFGIVPTSSGEIDDLGRPMLDDRSMYRIVCFARQRRPEPCPPVLTFSAPTAAYRLASFYDPQGTKNRRVSITAPDFRALAARAGQPPGPGGVEIVRPPDSQLMFDPDNGNAVPERDSDDKFDFGSETSRCTFALELLMIVAMFLFSLFLPIVVFLFQLWWLLLLRFCFPRPIQALQILAAHFASNGTIENLPDPPNVPFPLPEQRPADTQMLDDLLDAKGAADRLADPDPRNTFPATETGVGRDLVAALDPNQAETTLDRTPEAVPDDPFCE